jgi:amino acid transporter
LSGRDVLALVVGIVIGAGIFRAPALVAGAAPDEASLLLAWLAGGVLSIIGALCYAELAAAFPSIGGDVHFLNRAYGPRLGFLHAWARLAVIQTGSLALLAYVVGDYASVIAPLGPWSSSIYAASAVLLVSATNWAGVRLGAGAQRWLTLVEVAGLLLVIAAGFIAPASAGAPRTGGGGPGGIWVMMIFVLLTFGGWSEAAYVSTELKGAPQRLGRIMVAGLSLVTLLYLLANLAFLNALGLGGMAASDAVAAEVMRRTWGDGGAAAISGIVAVAALTSANATTLTGARSACALGRSYAPLRWLGFWNLRRGTPANAIIGQGAVALLLVIAGAFTRDGFRLAVEYTAPVFWGFMFLVGVGLFVLRAREPDASRPFRVPYYPVLPALFCVTSLYLLYASIAFTGLGALAGLAVLAGGALFLAFGAPANNIEPLGQQSCG